MGMTSARAWLAARGLEDRIREFDVSSATVELAAQALGVEPGCIAKTLSFYDGESALLVLAAGDAKRGPDGGGLYPRPEFGRRVL